MGSDVQGIKSTASEARRRRVKELNGQKMWVSNGLRSGVVFVLMKTDPQADPRSRMTCFITEKEHSAEQSPGLDAPPKIRKMGYKGVESPRLVYDGFATRPSASSVARRTGSARASCR